MARTARLPHLLRAALLALGLVLALVSISLPASAYTPPKIDGYVTDAAHKLGAAEIAALDLKLARYHDCSGNRVVVFLAATLEGESVEDVAYGAFNGWKLGDAKKDNGVLLLIAPNERKVRIETGKGVGGDLTDLESNRILREHVSANLKKDQFFAAVDEGTTEIERALQRSAKPLPDGGAACAPSPAAQLVGTPTERAPSTTTTPAQQPPEPSATKEPRGALMAVVYGLSVVLAFAAMFSRKAGWFGGCVTAFMSLVFGVFITIGGVGFLGWGSLLALPILIAVTIILRKVLSGLPRRSSSTGSSSSYDASSSSSSPWDSSSSGSSFSSDSSSGSSSSWDSGSSGSSGTDTSYSGGDGGSSGGGGSSDSY
jgi:uncharacterized protein